MVVQAGAERLRLADRDPETAHALLAIEEAGRGALSELRTMLGVLRDSGDDSLHPLPGLDDVAGLVDQVRRAGLPAVLTVELARQGPAEAPGAGAGLAAYRIVQEALTNVVRHSGLVPTQVTIGGDDSAVVVRVRNARGARIRDDRAPALGRGLVGMRERAASLGGSVRAGATADGGFEVEARLPHGDRAPTFERGAEVS
jgi:signal transduction histidine kinase